MPDVIDTTEPLFSEAAQAEIKKRQEECEAELYRTQQVLSQARQQVSALSQNLVFLEGRRQALAELLQPAGGPQKGLSAQNDTGLKEVSKNGSEEGRAEDDGNLPRQEQRAGRGR